MVQSDVVMIVYPQLLGLSARSVFIRSCHELQVFMNTMC